MFFKFLLLPMYTCFVCRKYREGQLHAGVPDREHPGANGREGLRALVSPGKQQDHVRPVDSKILQAEGI